MKKSKTMTTLALALALALTASHISGREYHAPLHANWNSPDRYGKWSVYDMESDPFSPGSGAIAVGYSTSDNMKLWLQCKSGSDGMEILFEPYSDFANFASAELANDGETATIQAVFPDGKPRRLDLVIPAGSKYWWLNDGAVGWFETGLRQGRQAFLRWRGREGTWGSEFDLTGSAKAITELKRRCNNDA